jgi:hypothetical protein
MDVSAGSSGGGFAVPGAATLLMQTADWRQQRFINVKVASSGAGTDLFEACAPISKPFTIRGIWIIADASNPAILIQFGYSTGDVFDDTTAHRATNLIDQRSNTQQAGFNDYINLCAQVITFVPLAITCDRPLSALWLRVNNKSGGTAVNVTAVFLIDFTLDSKAQTD